jgi:histidinol-phosphate aminotransferase
MDVTVDLGLPTTRRKDGFPTSSPCINLASRKQGSVIPAMPIMPGTLLPSHFSLNFCIRPNVMAFPKYQTSTSDHEKARSPVCLDANENSAGSCLVSTSKRKPQVNGTNNTNGTNGTRGTNGTNGTNGTHADHMPQQLVSLENLHRYPSASQVSLRRRIVEWRNLDCMC